MSNGPSWYSILPVAVIAAAVPVPGAATVYMSIDEAQRMMFPGARFVPHPIAFTAGQRKAVVQASGAQPYDKVQRVWEVRTGDRRIGWFFVDRVIGKHDFITYAVAMSSDGAIRGVEILDYRESYGGEIRNPNWRQQFVGKRPGAAVKLGADIKNISGATLSSRHVADGVRRLLATYRLLLSGA
jgi:Na+-translocating ferredoxin:NAD+ oxidoreductase RnfG subunit